MKYKLKDNVNFKMVSKKVLLTYDINLDTYYNEKK